MDEGAAGYVYQLMPAPFTACRTHKPVSVLCRRVEPTGGPGVQRLSSTLVMESVVENRPLPL
jgi:hypothetical protein